MPSPRITSDRCTWARRATDSLSEARSQPYVVRRLFRGQPRHADQQLRGLAISFLDLFSRQAATYAAARPSYPDELFAFIASLVSRRSLAWDCATGNGQAAVDLARYFDRVIATDASAPQIASAAPRTNVEYRVAAAEDSGLAEASIDLVTVAQALHWLDRDRFYREVRRVTVPGGVVAAWCYGSCSAGKDVDPLLRELEFAILEPYWHEGRHWVEEGYRTIPFPFDEVAAPNLELRRRWTLRELGEYLHSWSAVASFRSERGEDPVAPLLERLANHWDADESRTITWPLGIRVGRIA
jgi:SAM-dependent methyltransferase